MTNFQDKVGFLWSVADLLRGDYKQSEYGKVILPLTVLRRLDSVLEKTKDKVLTKALGLPAKADEQIRHVMLCQAAGQSFYNLSKFTFRSLLDDPNHLAANLNHYIEKQVGETNKIAACIRHQIAKLREYRQALISAAVTGKLAPPQEVPS